MIETNLSEEIIKKYKPTVLEEERRRRIQVCIWACAYELYSFSIVPDNVYDETCKKIDLSISTNRKDLDRWFKNNFDPSTGMWIHTHPNLDRLEEIVLTHYAHLIAH